jgi:2-oxoglutarate dehydrogenase E1 component
MTPKSLLRLPECTSSIEDLADSKFQRVIPDRETNAKNVKRILLCSGKIFYELDAERKRLGREDIAIVRIEQFYPLPNEELVAVLNSYVDDTSAYWVQEEPENMGAWHFIRVHYGERLFGRLPLSGICRPESATPATGSHSSHKIEQKRILDRAFGAANMDW